MQVTMEQFAEAARVAAKREQDAKVLEIRTRTRTLTLTLTLSLTLPLPLPLTLTLTLTLTLALTLTLTKVIENRLTKQLDGLRLQLERLTNA